MMIYRFNMNDKYDNFDLDNLFLIINNTNLDFYLKKYNCSNELELEDNLWFNYGITIKII
jgi:hypothetical protein